MIKESEKDAIKNNNFQYFEDKLAKGIELDSYLISEAVHKKNKKMIDYFLSKGCEFNSPFAIRSAIKKNDNIAYIKWLESRGIDIYHGGGINLFCASINGCLEIFSYMYGNKDTKLPDFNTNRLFLNIVARLNEVNEKSDKNFETLQYNFKEMLALLYHDVPKDNIELEFSKIKNPEYKSDILSRVLNKNIDKNKNIKINKQKL